MKGLTMQIVRPGRRVSERVWTSIDCSNDGISAHVDQVTIVGIRDDSGLRTGVVEQLGRRSRVVEPTEQAPACVLVRRYLVGNAVWHVEPLLVEGWKMAGGTYCATSDSRINEITGVYGALPLHDRVER